MQKITCAPGVYLGAEDKTNMYAENSHLELMKLDPRMDTWRSKGVFYLPVPTFTSATQKRFLDFATQTPETSVRQAQVWFAADAQSFITEYIIEDKSLEGAIEKSIAVTIGGLACTGIELREVGIARFQVAWLRELLHINPDAAIDHPSFNQIATAVSYLPEAKHFYQEAA